LSLALFVPLMVPYGSFLPAAPGNRNWDPYIGEPGSTYDRQANPPQANGRVTYNPLAPLPSVAPAAPSGSASPAR
jgi:hypothetical protein